MIKLTHTHKVLVSVVTFAGTSAGALQIDLDYGHDSFLTGNAAAMAALEAAASDIGQWITTSLAPLPATSSETAGTATVTYDWKLQYTHPEAGGDQEVLPPDIPGDTVRIYVGGRNLAGTTLGEGGSGGIAFNVGLNIPGSLPISQIPQTLQDVSDAEDLAEAAGVVIAQRGGGPLIGTYSGGFSGGYGPGYEYSESWSISYGLALGNLWFDTTPDEPWHFDHTTDPAPNTNDFYSVALHELLHALGLGGSQSWDALVDGTNWTGAAVADLLGSGNGILDGDGAHLKSNLKSVRLDNGLEQEAVMDPSLTLGTRKYLTQLDLALLEDVGWEIVPEPSALALLAFGTPLLLRRRT